MNANYDCLGDLDYFMKPTKYANGEVDKSGPKVRKVIETFLKEKPKNIYCVGDSEEGFDIDHMDILDDLIDWGTPIMAVDSEYDEEHNVETNIRLYETKLGNICVYSGESYFGTTYCCFAVEKTATKIEEYIETKIEKI